MGTTVTWEKSLESWSACWELSKIIESPISTCWCNLPQLGWWKPPKTWCKFLLCTGLLLEDSSVTLQSKTNKLLKLRCYAWMKFWLNDWVWILHSVVFGKSSNSEVKFFNRVWNLRIETPILLRKKLIK